MPYRDFDEQSLEEGWGPDIRHQIIPPCVKNEGADAERDCWTCHPKPFRQTQTGTAESPLCTNTYLGTAVDID